MILCHLSFVLEAVIDTVISNGDCVGGAIMRAKSGGGPLQLQWQQGFDVEVKHTDQKDDDVFVGTPETVIDPEKNKHNF